MPRVVRYSWPESKGMYEGWFDMLPPIALKWNHHFMTVTN